MLWTLLLSSCITAIFSYPNKTELMPTPLIQGGGQKPSVCSETEYSGYPWICCQKCPADEVSTHKCTSASDTICQCKPGTYLCQHNKNCSNPGTCVPCASCQPGQRVTHECNATSDTACEEDILMGSPSKTLTKEAIIALAVVTAILIVILIVFIIVRKRWSGTGKTISNEDDEGITENGEIPEERPTSQDSVSSYTELLSHTEEISCSRVATEPVVTTEGPTDVRAKGFWRMLSTQMKCVTMTSVKSL